MRSRSYAVTVGLLVLLSTVAAGNRTEAQGTNDQGQQIMTPASDPNAAAANNGIDQRQSLIDNLSLKDFEAAAGDLSACGDDNECVKHAKGMKSWNCAAALCDGKDNSKEPISCFKGRFGDVSTATLEQMNEAICPLIKSPGAETRKEFLNLPTQNGTITEDDLVRTVAYVFASKESALPCNQYIKDYVGAYGSKWDYSWFRALSGCRILAHESTRAQEEKDFYAWLGVAQGSNKCADIVNTEMRNECYNPQATAALTSYAQ